MKKHIKKFVINFTNKTAFSLTLRTKLNNII